MKSRVTLIACLFVFFSVFAFAQKKPVPVPRADGKIGSDEYARTYTVDAFTLRVSHSGNDLFFALSVKTHGWVAVGLGTGRMHGSTLFIGSVQNGKAEFTEQLGRGHAHGDIPASKRTTRTFAVSENGDTTTMEFSCAALPFVPAGTREITVILAYSRSDSLWAPHVTRRAVQVQLE